MGIAEDVDMADKEQPSLRQCGTDQQFLAKPVKSAVDKFQLLPESLKGRVLVKQQLDSFNYFVRTEIKKIVLANDLITVKDDPSIYLRYEGVRIGEPSMIIGDLTEKLTPHKCQLSDTTYAAPIYVNIEYRNGQKAPPQEKKDVIIGRMPIMLRSCCCVLHGKDEDELSRLGECPLDPGGNFVVKGTEKEYVGNKRLELSGQLLSLLFEDLFKTMNDEVKKTVNCILERPSRSRFDISQYITKDIITVGLERTLSTGSWYVQRFRMHRTGLTQTLSRSSRF